MASIFERIRARSASSFVASASASRSRRAVSGSPRNARQIARQSATSSRRGEAGNSGFDVTTHGGKRGAGIDAVDWAVQAQAAGVGEILLNSIDADGTKEGFDLEMLRALRTATTCPLIASGGAGRAEHFTEAAQAGADAVLAASVFHFGIVRIADVKAGLRQAGFQVV